MFSASGWAYADGHKGFMEKLVGMGLEAFFSKTLNMCNVRTKKKKFGEDIRNERIQRNQTQREDKKKR